MFFWIFFAQSTKFKFSRQTSSMTENLKLVHSKDYSILQSSFDYYHPSIQEEKLKLPIWCPSAYVLTLLLPGIVTATKNFALLVSKLKSLWPKTGWRSTTQQSIRYSLKLLVHTQKNSNLVSSSFSSVKVFPRILQWTLKISQDSST